jgi:hypothetical protein
MRAFKQDAAQKDRGLREVGEVASPARDEGAPDTRFTSGDPVRARRWRIAGTVAWAIGVLFLIAAIVSGGFAIKMVLLAARLSRWVFASELPTGNVCTRRSHNSADPNLRASKHN